ncbi:hypothetical protein SAMN02910340_02094 [Methanosarcina thermophila]|jgi:hypothetical protein|uniref:Uncharacterized protein n=1 Tax=Methanosarcina thermophila TaxID=2210 RepID=A0A1I7AEZ9_METTE|nr:hypothetical protein [Methanosarcina thermophila]SFT73410.1 hypothetical protein SAMN02910340_02094 [Methanosarcina thermophila]BAW29904.1 conserved hypothetical protein [Methanosarcina thermophila]GLI14193.1 hypothetical protein MTHERMMSTA1_13190 [Methanosarcina thermophila MST-A1]HOA69156.1 hypothetical protein [Methanosarcina thermophila]HPZ20409.1 hypothetical protein [Methanosarcina thermophila]
MIGSLMLGMIHTCNILSSTQDQKLSFESGSSAFLEEDLLIGVASGAKGTIKEIVLESGSWTAGDAAGYLILSNVSGTFQEGETIHDEHEGTSLASGPAEPVTNGVGTPQLTTTSNPSSCRFSQASRSGGIQSLESGDYIVSEPLLFLPPETVIQEGDIVTSNVHGYEGPYKVLHVEVLYELFMNASGEYEIDHLEVELKAVKKRG